MPTKINAPSPAAMAARWQFLEQNSDACSVITRRMELLYLNTAARALTPSQWFGRRCWQVFPVADQSCAARCPVVQAFDQSSDILYCEETVYPAGQPPLVLSVAVIPLPTRTGETGQALLMLRPKTGGELSARAQLLADASRMRAHCLSELQKAA
jgi:hypothetical protein